MKNLSLKNKILSVIAAALVLVILIFAIWSIVAYAVGSRPDKFEYGEDDTVYEFTFTGGITLLDVDYEVKLNGSDGNFSLDANTIKGVTSGTYTYTEGQGWTFTFNDAGGTIVRSQFDAETKAHSFIYHLDLGSRGAGNLRLSYEDEDFVRQGEPWADIPSFSGVGMAGITVVVSCDTDNNFRIFATPASPAPVTEISGTYEYKDGHYVLTATDGTVYTSTVNEESGLQEFKDMMIYIPALSAPMPFTLTQVILTVD